MCATTLSLMSLPTPGIFTLCGHMHPVGVWVVDLGRPLTDTHHQVPNHAYTEGQLQP